MEISLCMIVKDEEDVIERCLNSVSNVIDEVIIVDTGSSDTTIEKVKSLGAKVYNFEWINDFSKARNFSFSKATKDYILWIDADDILTENDAERLLNLKENLDENVDSVTMNYILEVDENNKPLYSLKRNRLVKRSRNFKWVGYVHEYLEVYGKGLEGNFAIEHGKIKEYTDRNLKIFKDMEKNNKNFTPRDMYYYANELFDNKYYNEAINKYRKFIDSKQGWIEDVKSAYLRIINSLNIIDNKEKIPDIAFESFKIDTPTAEIACNLGNYYMEKKSFKQAAFWYRVALDSRPDSYNMAISNSGYYTWIPSLQLCVCYYNLGKIKCAYFFNELAATFNEEEEKILYNRNMFLIEFKELNIEEPKLEYPLKLSDYIKYL